MTTRGLGFVVLVLAGCGAPPSVEEYAAELERAYCDWQHACHNYPSVDECLAARGLDADPEFAYLARAVAAGTAEYDGESALACLEATRGLGCEDGSADTPAACEGVFRGRIGRNGPCMSSLECVGDAVCGFDPSCADMCCAGACRVFADPLEEGEACGGSVACADGLFCAADPMTFLPTVCTPRVTEGGACGNGETCEEETYCDGAECRAWTEKEAGETCDGPGERCAGAAECHYFEGESGYEQRCVAPGGLGAACDPADSESCARFDTHCDPDAKKCALLPKPGAACSEAGCVGWAMCVGGGGFDEFGQPIGTPGTCMARAGAGQACGGDGDVYVECLGELWCEEGVCALPPPPEMSRFDCPVPIG